MTKIDSHNHKEEYLRWKEKNSDSIESISKYNSDIILQYLDNMEKGINISSWSNKGSRIMSPSLHHDIKKIFQVPVRCQDSSFPPGHLFYRR